MSPRTRRANGLVNRSSRRSPGVSPRDIYCATGIASMARGFVAGCKVSGSKKYLPLRAHPGRIPMSNAWLARSGASASITSSSTTTAISNGSCAPTSPTTTLHEPISRWTSSAPNRGSLKDRSEEISLLSRTLAVFTTSTGVPRDPRVTARPLFVVSIGYPTAEAASTRPNSASQYWCRRVKSRTASSRSLLSSNRPHNKRQSKNLEPRDVSDWVFSMDNPHASMKGRFPLIYPWFSATKPRRLMLHALSGQFSFLRVSSVFGRFFRAVPPEGTGMERTHYRGSIGGNMRPQRE